MSETPAELPTEPTEAETDAVADEGTPLPDPYVGHVETEDMEENVIELDEPAPTDDNGNDPDAGLDTGTEDE